MYGVHIPSIPLAKGPCFAPNLFRETFSFGFSDEQDPVGAASLLPLLSACVLRFRGFAGKGGFVHVG